MFLYDFANTIFSMNVISLYFALWVTVDHGGQDILYSATLSLYIAVSVPVFGAISDITSKCLTSLHRHRCGFPIS
jgi:MFS transporter, UMF1 family